MQPGNLSKSKKQACYPSHLKAKKKNKITEQLTDPNSNRSKRQPKHGRMDYEAAVVLREQLSLHTRTDEEATLASSSKVFLKRFGRDLNR